MTVSYETRGRNGHIPKQERDDVARMSVAFVRTFGEKDTLAMLQEALKVSRSTAQHIVRRGMHLAANQGDAA
jgi:hypothetical protein